MKLICAVDRTKKVSKPAELEAWLGFDFPGRHNKHSSQKYHWQHFSGTDYNAATKKMAIYKILGYNDKWSRAVDTSEKGNLDYLMFANLEYGHPEVQQDVKRWGEWLGKEVKIRGMRLDAVRHISADFLTDFIRHLERTVGGGISATLPFTSLLVVLTLISKLVLCGRILEERRRKSAKIY